MRLLAILLFVGCSRSTQTQGTEVQKKPAPAKASETAKPAPAPAPSAEPAPAVEAEDSKRKLEPFLAVIATKVPANAYARPTVTVPKRPAVDPLTAKGTTTHY